MKLNKSLLITIAVVVVLVQYCSDESDQVTVSTSLPTSSSTPATSRSAQTNSGGLTPLSGDVAVYPGLSRDWGILDDVTGIDASGGTTALTMKNYYVIFDGSRSMLNARCADGSNKAAVAKKVLKTFVDAVPAQTNLGLLAFDRAGISERIPLAVGNREPFKLALEAIQPDGGTPLKDAMALGFRILHQQAARQRGYGEYTLLVVTDGEASSGQAPAPVVDHILAFSPIVIETIGFCIGNQHSLNQPGRTVYKSANNEAELLQGLEDVLAEAESFQLQDAAQFGE